MRIITLNTWGGREMEPLLDFFQRHAADTDIFCLQEVLDTDEQKTSTRADEKPARGDIFRRISAVLKDFDGAFARFDGKPNRLALAMFVRQSMPHAPIIDFVAYAPPKPPDVERHFSRKLQYTIADAGGRRVLVVNFHGLWQEGGKIDTPDRLAQSRSVKDFLKKHDGPIVLCGDFNLLPETESLAILSEGMRELVTEMKIPKTRTSLYRHYDNPDEPNFADYMLTTPDLEVKRFEVLPDIVSDHSPLLLDIA
jgi:endonuclease/exonuclease/phosphatase family metal-dependent hydrolase